MEAKIVYGIEVPEETSFTVFKEVIRAKGQEIPFGYKIDPFDERDFTIPKLEAVFDKPLFTVEKQKIDHTAEMTAVKDQQFEGTCVGFAVAAMKEWQEKKERSTWSFSKWAIKDLSERYIYFKAREPYGWDNATNQGAYIRDGFKAVYNFGAIIETGWPYRPGDWVSQPDPRRLVDSPRYKINNYVRLEDTDRMAQWLIEGGPFVTGVAVFEEFYNDQNGFIEFPEADSYLYGYHSICIVGYDPDGWGHYDEPAFKFKNSWGLEWGDQGYGYLPESYIMAHSDDTWGSIDYLTSIAKAA